jgi:hypothetical protein
MRGDCLLLSTFLALIAGCGGSNESPGSSPTPPSPPIETIAEFTVGRVQAGGGLPPLVLGQSVIVLRQGSFNSLRFQWQRFGAGGAIMGSATGRVFLLNREYLGPVRDLSSSVDGFVAVSTSIVDDEYVFENAIAVQPGVKYWFYSNDQGHTLLASDGNQDLYTSGEMYVASVGDRFAVFYPFGRGTERVDANFILRGRPVR